MYKIIFVPHTLHTFSVMMQLKKHITININNASKDIPVTLLCKRLYFAISPQSDTPTLGTIHIQSVSPSHQTRPFHLF